jgi:hypothetical protein
MVDRAGSEARIGFEILTGSNPGGFTIASVQVYDTRGLSFSGFDLTSVCKAVSKAGFNARP